MGASIHSYVEVLVGEDCWVWLQGPLFDNGTERWAPQPWEPFYDKSYTLFGFLAGVRDRDVPQIHPCRGLPADLSPELRAKFGFTFPDDCTHYPPVYAGPRSCFCVYHDDGLHSHSWATGAELLGYDFGREFTCPYEHGPDRRYQHLDECAHWLAGTPKVTVAEYLGDWLERFAEIAALDADPNRVRVVFAFDN